MSKRWQYVLQQLGPMPDKPADVSDEEYAQGQRLYAEFQRKANNERIGDRREEISGAEDFGNGVSRGLARTGTSIARGISMIPGLDGLRDWADETDQQVNDYYDTGDTPAGNYGTIAGRVAGEGATAYATGATVMKGVGAFAPRVGAALAAGTESASPWVRAAARVAPAAPLSFAVGAGQQSGDVGSWERMKGGLANVGMDMVGGRVLEGMRGGVMRGPASALEASDARLNRMGQGAGDYAPHRAVAAKATTPVTPVTGGKGGAWGGGAPAPTPGMPTPPMPSGTAGAAPAAVGQMLGTDDIPLLVETEKRALAAVQADPATWQAMEAADPAAARAQYEALKKQILRRLQAAGAAQPPAAPAPAPTP